MTEIMMLAVAALGLGVCIGWAVFSPSAPPARSYGVGHVFGGYKDGDERFIRDCEHPTEPPVCRVYYGGKWWTAWGGGPCPVLDCVRVDVRFRDGREVKNCDPGGWNWDHVPSPHRSNPDGDIIAYRLSDAPA